LSSFKIVEGSHATDWGVTPNLAVDVAAVIVNPFVRQFPENTFDNTPMALVISGPRYKERIGLCLFPEILRPELHEIRSVVEAYSNKTLTEQIEHPVVGYTIALNAEGFRLEVETVDAVVKITIDRFE
jgi:hypothetical protein